MDKKMDKRRHRIKGLTLKSYKRYTNLAFIFKISHGKRYKQSLKRKP